MKKEEFEKQKSIFKRKIRTLEAIRTVLIQKAVDRSKAKNYGRKIN